MRDESFKIRLKNLPLKEKLILIGSFVTFISVFFPWYADMDKFQTGDMFLGITGPLYLTGLIVLLSSGASFLFIMMKLKGKIFRDLPIKEYQLHMLFGGIALLMLVIANSVFFHSKFGTNLTEKSMGIGMIMSFMGLLITAFGSALMIKSKEVDFDAEGKLDPLIDLKERTQQDLDPSMNEILQDDLETHDTLNDLIETPNKTDDANRF